MSKVLTVLALSLLLTASALADGHRHHHRRHHHHDDDDYHGHGRYVPVAPMPAPRYYDQRSGTGLVGGMVGSAVGYEMGRGDPLAAGVGAAAGAWLGNGMAR